MNRKLGTRFWSRRSVEEGNKFVLVDANDTEAPTIESREAHGRLDDGA